MRDDLDIPMPAMGPAAGGTGYRVPRQREGMDPNTRKLARIAAGIGGTLVLRLGAWSEAQLGRLQKQTARIDLLRGAHSSFEAERAAVCGLLGTVSDAELRKIFAGFGNPGDSFWKQLAEHPEGLLISAGPRGWRYQNMATVARLEWRGFPL